MSPSRTRPCPCARQLAAKLLPRARAHSRRSPLDSALLVLRLTVGVLLLAERVQAGDEEAVREAGELAGMLAER